MNAADGVTPCRVRAGSERNEELRLGPINTRAVLASVAAAEHPQTLTP
jgi:hypothetical protein